MKFLTVLSTVVTVFSALASAASFTNPLKAKDGSDPHIVYTGGYYYMMVTSWTDLRITRAKTLGGLKTGEVKTVWKDSDSTRCCNVWAPEMHYIDGSWYIYYTAGQSANLDLQRPHVLKGGATPWDTYTYHARLSGTWGIDGTILRMPQGNYFVWSAMTSVGQSLRIAPMTAPGKLGSSAVLSEPTQSWEKVGAAVMEGPAAMYHGGKTFLAYSASYCWTTSYQLGVLTWNGGDPMLAASWKKTGPHFSSANGNYGTGHNGFFQSPDGTEIWNVFHATANSAGACDPSRYTMAQKVNWNSDGSPNFGAAQKLGTTIAGPSGE